MIRLFKDISKLLRVYLNNILSSFFGKYLLAELICMDIFVIVNDVYDIITSNILNNEDLEICCFLVAFFYSIFIEMFNMYKSTKHIFHKHKDLVKSLCLIKLKKFYGSLVIDHIEILAFVLSEIYTSAKSNNSFVFINSAGIICIIIPLSFTIFTVMDKNYKKLIVKDPNSYIDESQDDKWKEKLQDIKEIIVSNDHTIFKYKNARNTIVRNLNNVINSIKNL